MSAMRFVVLCLLLLPACDFLGFPSDQETAFQEYVLRWTCIVPEGCERTEEVQRIDHATVVDYRDYHFTSTQDPSFGEDALRVNSSALGYGCFWLYFLSLFGHEIERSMICLTPGGFEFELSIPNADPATQSRWLVTGRDLAFL
jgi:hypothetical protein